MKTFLAALLLAAGLFCPCAHPQQNDATNQFWKQIEKQFEENKAKAEHGDAKAQLAVGAWYAGESGLKPNPAEAMKWYRKAAEQGNVHAQFWLACGYHKGEGVEKDYADAVKWYRKAAEQGLVSAQNKLGECYVSGIGVEPNSMEAMKWYRKAAEQDNADAQFWLGLFFAGAVPVLGNEKAIEKDDVESYAWYNLSSKTDPLGVKARDALEKKMSPQQVTAAQKRTRELRAQIEAKLKSGG